MTAVPELDASRGSGGGRRRLHGGCRDRRGVRFDGDIHFRRRHQHLVDGSQVRLVELRTFGLLVLLLEESHGHRRDHVSVS